MRKTHQQLHPRITWWALRDAQGFACLDAAPAKVPQHLHINPSDAGNQSAIFASVHIHHSARSRSEDI